MIDSALNWIINFAAETSSMVDNLREFLLETLERTSQTRTAHLSQAELDKLPEYSTSLPTSTTFGKVWKCKERGGGWKLGIYVPSRKPGKVRIVWSQVVVD